MSNTAEEMAFPDGGATATPPKERLRIAADPGTRAEILDRLARDSVAEIRRAVAANPANSQQSDVTLSGDEDERVRAALGCKVAIIGLGGDRESKRWRDGFMILETLACDSSVVVRRTVAQALKGQRDVPFAIVTGLSRDPDAEVSVTVLEHSPLLEAPTLVKLIENGLPEFTMNLLAGKVPVRGPVSAAIVAQGSVMAVTALIENDRAEIPDAVMSEIVDRAPGVTDWHGALVHRKDLAERFVVRLARFVPPELLTSLKARRGLRPEMKGVIDRVALARSELSKQAMTRDAAYGIAPGAAPEAGAGNAWESSEDRAARLNEEGQLDDETIEQAIADADKEFVIQALALRADIPLSMASRIIGVGGAKVVTALCWSAKLPLRTAADVQERIAETPAKDIIRGGGPYYPMLESEMSRLLKLFRG